MASGMLGDPRTPAARSLRFVATDASLILDSKESLQFEALRLAGASVYAGSRTCTCYAGPSKPARPALRSWLRRSRCLGLPPHGIADLGLSR